MVIRTATNHNKFFTSCFEKDSHERATSDFVLKLSNVVYCLGAVGGILI